MAVEKSPRRSFTNGIRPVHAVILLVFLLARNCFSASTGLVPQNPETTEASSKPILASAKAHSDHSKSASDHGPSGHGAGAVGSHGDEEAEERDGAHEMHEYEVFHVEFDRVEIPFIIALWIFVSSLAKIGFHMTPKVAHIFPESCLLIVVGILIGFLLFLTTDHPPSTLTPDVFFLYMLPPIILDAGYFMPNRLFFDHLGTILLMAVVGTIFNALTIGGSLYACGLTGIFGEDYPSILETFLFSSLISAVDPVAVIAVFEEIHVDEILYIVVFGESLLNDAVTVVLYHMFEAYVELGEDNLGTTDMLKGLASFIVVAGGGTIVGIIWGYVIGFVTRFTNHARILEPLFVFTMAYLSYLTAEIFHLSGIMAITFCGITCKNYVERNISANSQTTLKYAMKMLSGSSETIIFMFLGVATIHDDHVWNWPYVCLTILFCTVYRTIGVLLQSALANRYRLHKLKPVDQFVLSYGGIRGAIAFALALLIDKKKVPHGAMFVTTTIAMVYWTVFVQGITIKPLVRYLNVKTSSEKDPTMNERIAGRFMDHVIAGMEGVLGELGYLRIRDMYKHIDAKYIKPCLLRENKFKDPKIIETFETLTNRDALEFVKRNPTQFSGLGGSKTMAELTAMTSSSTMNRSPSALIASANFGRNQYSFTVSHTIAHTQPKPQSNNGQNVHISPNPSSTNVENLDMKEMYYNKSQKDLTEEKIHHLLSENLFMPKNRPRRLSYSRHAVDDKHIELGHPINYKVHMQVRRMVSENRLRRRKHHHNNPTNGTKGSRDQTSSNSVVKFAPGLRVAGSSKQLRDHLVHQVIKETNNQLPAGPEDEGSDGDDDGGITFGTHPIPAPTGSQPHRGKTNYAYVEESDEDQVDNSQTEEPAQASVLPWKRQNTDSEVNKPMKQSEFPSWINNKEYTQNYSPYNTVNANKDLNGHPSIINAFLNPDSTPGHRGSDPRRGSQLEQQHLAFAQEARLLERRGTRLARSREASINTSIDNHETCIDLREENEKL